MKRTYKLLGYLLLGIEVYALINANNTGLQAKQRISADRRLATTGDTIASRPATQQQTPRKRNRHTITLVLSQLSDLKVEEGQRINVGDIIARSHYRKNQAICVAVSIIDKLSSSDYQPFYPALNCPSEN